MPNGGFAEEEGWHESGNKEGWTGVHGPWIGSSARLIRRIINSTFRKGLVPFDGLGSEVMLGFP